MNATWRRRKQIQAWLAPDNSRRRNYEVRKKERPMSLARLRHRSVCLFPEDVLVLMVAFIQSWDIISRNGIITKSRSYMCGCGRVSVGVESLRSSYISRSMSMGRS